MVFSELDIASEISPYICPSRYLFGSAISVFSCPKLRVASPFVKQEKRIRPSLVKKCLPYTPKDLIHISHLEP